MGGGLNSTSLAATSYVRFKKKKPLLQPRDFAMLTTNEDQLLNEPKLPIILELPKPSKHCEMSSLSDNSGLEERSEQTAVASVDCARLLIRGHPGLGMG